MSGADEVLSIERDARGVATLTLRRENRHNALDGALIEALTEAARALAAEEAVRVVVLTGGGLSFCAGGDMGWFAAAVDKDRAGRLEDSDRLAAMFEAIDTLPKPVIGRINGQAFGGGLGLISVCDVAIGLSAARFGLTEVRLGLAPATISPFVIRRIGLAPARATMLSGALFDGARAAAMGLLTEAVESEAELDARVAQIVADHLEASGQAVAATKALIADVAAALGSEGPAALKARTAAALADVWESRDGRLGVAAFLEKRRPPWRGGE